MKATFNYLLAIIFFMPVLMFGQERQPTSTTVKGNITKAEIEQKVPGSVVTEKGKDKATGETIYEVQGDHTAIRQSLSGNSKVSLVRSHPEYSGQQLQAINRLGDALLDYAGSTGWRIKGGSWVKGTNTQDHEPRIYLCWMCKDCTEPLPPPMLPKTSCPRPANLDDLYNEWLKWAALTNVLTELLNAYNLFGFWKGVANMTQDIINAAGLLIPGAGSVAAKGLNMLIKMAVNGALDALMGSVMDALGVPDINSKAACAAALEFANGKRLETLAAYNEVWYEYIACVNKVNSDIAGWNKERDKYLKELAAYQKCMDNPNRCGWVECK